MAAPANLPTDHTNIHMAPEAVDDTYAARCGASVAGMACTMCAGHGIVGSTVVGAVAALARAQDAQIWTDTPHVACLGRLPCAANVARDEEREIKVRGICHIVCDSSHNLRAIVRELGHLPFDGTTQNIHFPCKFNATV